MASWAWLGFLLHSFTSLAAACNGDASFCSRRDWNLASLDQFRMQDAGCSECFFWDSFGKSFPCFLTFNFWTSVDSHFYGVDGKTSKMCLMCLWPRLPLTKFTFAGTHNSGSFNLNIPEVIKAGVRADNFFLVRHRHIRNHSAAKCILNVTCHSQRDKFAQIFEFHRCVFLKIGLSDWPCLNAS